MKLFVGNLSWNTDDDSLRDAFSEYGDVDDAVVVRERDTGRSRGFGFVTFSDASAGEAAVNGMNGQELDGRPINVAEAHDRRR